MSKTSSVSNATTKASPENLTIRPDTLAAKLFNLHNEEIHSQTFENPIKVVCISDTHNSTPELPPGDILVHSGDLIYRPCRFLDDSGKLRVRTSSPSDSQKALDWLNSQASKYQHVVLIAGNHDVWFDKNCLDKFPELTRDHTANGVADFNFGRIIYLNNETTELEFQNGRKLKIFGNPASKRFRDTPSSFLVEADADVWTGTVPEDVDILLSHGPPLNHCDQNAKGTHEGWRFLTQEVNRVRPKLVVFGHIHEGYGMECVRFDQARKIYEGIVGGWAQKGDLARLAWFVLWGRVKWLIGMGGKSANAESSCTTFVNAALKRQDLTLNEPIVVQI